MALNDRLTRLRPLGSDEAEDANPAAVAGTSSSQSSLAINGLLLALSALSKRSVIALAQLVNLMFCFSAFALWWRVLPEPSVLQLVGLALYGVFVIVLVLFRRG